LSQEVVVRSVFLWSTTKQLEEEQQLHFSVLLFYQLCPVLPGSSSPLCFWLGRLLLKEEEVVVQTRFFFFQEVKNHVSR